LLEGSVAHIHDGRKDPDFDLTAGMQLWGARTLLGVPLLREAPQAFIEFMKRCR
jgi:hypothetical protein